MNGEVSLILEYEQLQQTYDDPMNQVAQRVKSLLLLMCGFSIKISYVVPFQGL
ncbi:uncharacterized protein DS421_20g704630 [Arachis hypogaea]|nr:uncharacterized protein DS421_20g704630 [Arachis hypogaea]